VSWKPGTTDTLQALPIRDSIMAVADEDYFDWPVLPEAPSSLKLSLSGNSVRLTWQVHGGNPTAIKVERKIEDGKDANQFWTEIAKLPATASAYSDATVTPRENVVYRVRASNTAGESAYSNLVRAALPAMK
ncbi:MAG TPA: fibronectin type III domain-containing protein, partial [Terriglobales bacterium]|nr:fibronectin type III domain-containing protein [Terriglobales bacterium]